MTELLAEFPATAKTQATSELLTVTMTVTPAQAQTWLDQMPNQRRLRRTRVEMLKRAVVKGRWRLLPHGIVLDRDGHVIDGQHRLQVITETGRALAMRVTYNADPSMFLAIDSAITPKDVADALQHEGVPHGLCPIVAKTTRMIWRDLEGRSPLDSTHPTNEEAIEAFRLAGEPLLEAARLAKLSRSIVPSTGLLSYYLYLGLGHRPTDTREFAQKLATGEDLHGGSPILLLRNGFMQDRSMRVTKSSLAQAVHIMTALNAHFLRRQMKSWRGTEIGKNKVPALAGNPTKA